MIIQKHFENEHKFDFSNTVGIPAISKQLRLRTTAQVRKMRKYDPPKFIQEIRKSKGPSVLRSIQTKEDKNESREFYLFPTFGIYGYSSTNKCSACPTSWKPSEKEKLGTFSDDTKAVINHNFTQNIYMEIDCKQTNDCKTFFSLLCDADWNYTAFQTLFKYNAKSDKKLTTSANIFNFFMDQYHHSTASNSSAFSEYIENSSKAKVCIHLHIYKQRSIYDYIR